MTTDDFTTAATEHGINYGPCGNDPELDIFISGAEWARDRLAAHDARVSRDAVREAANQLFWDVELDVPTRDHTRLMDYADRIYAGDTDEQ